MPNLIAKYQLVSGQWRFVFSALSGELDAFYFAFEQKKPIMMPGGAFATFLIDDLFYDNLLFGDAVVYALCTELE